MSQHPSPHHRQKTNISNSSIEGQVGQSFKDLWQFQFLFGGEPEQLRQAQQNRQALIDKVRNCWIKNVLQKSLHNQVIMQLNLENRLDLIDQPFKIDWTTPEQLRGDLPSGTKIIDLFNNLGEGGNLLILGGPGAGKTLSLLGIAQILLDQAEQDTSHPVPAIFNLASWRNQAIDDWLIQEFKENYYIGKRISSFWIQSENLVLFLDGLDEIRRDLRDSCILALNQFFQKHGKTKTVLCSRIQDYEALEQRLKFQAAVSLKPLTYEQVDIYLAQNGQISMELRGAILRNHLLKELIKTPLVLNLILLAFQDDLSQSLLYTNSEQEYLKYLFNAYIKRMLFRRRSEYHFYDDERTKRWLFFLAKQMQKESQTIFLIENLQPSWLFRKTERRLYKAALLILFSLVGGSIIGPKTGLLLGAVTGSISSKIKTVDAFKWSWAGVRRGLFFGFIVIALLWLAISTIIGVNIGIQGGSLLIGLYASWLSSIKNLVNFGIVFGIIGGLIGGLEHKEVEKKVIPNQGIRKSLVNALLIGFLSALISGILIGLPMAVSFEKPLLILKVAFVLGILSGILFGGGKACIQHFILRCLLYFKGYTPWNYKKFLDYASERIFLQKVGGGYIFIHRLLLEHFAEQMSYMSPEKD